MKLNLPPEVKAMFARAGRKGGKATSKEKAAAAKRNGKLGGRPRKKAK